MLLTLSFFSFFRTSPVAAHFKIKYRPFEVRRGQEASFKCEAEGDKPISIIWKMSDKIFNPKNDPRFELLESESREGVTSEIVIRQTTRDDSHVFTCHASNEFGSDETKIQLVVQEPPDPPGDLKSYDIDGRHATISWSPPYAGNSAITNYIIQFKTVDDKWSSPRVVNTTVTGTESYVQIRGLKPVTYYEVRGFSVNNMGRSEASPIIKLTTDEEAPGGPPLHVKVVALSSRSCRVTWKPPRLDLQYGIVTGYYVGYRVSDQDSFIYKTLELQTSKANSMESIEECLLTGLKKFTKYSIMVQAFNKKGTGPSSEVIEVQTLQNDPPPAPVLKVTSVTTSVIHLSWIMRPEESDDQQPPVQPPVTGFILHQKRPEVTEWEELTLPGDRQSHSFDRLPCGSKFQYYIMAFNGVGKSDPSEILSCKTEGSAPVAPDRNSLISSNMSAAVIFLDSFHDGSCPISSFEIFYKAKKSNRKADSVRIFPGEEKQHVIRDLLPATVYEVRIVASNQAGRTEAAYTFTTASLIRVPNIHANEASVTFSPPLVLDVTLILPATISLVMIILLIFIIKIWIMKKRHHHHSPAAFYGTVYGSCCPVA